MGVEVIYLERIEETRCTLVDTLSLGGELVASAEDPGVDSEESYDHELTSHHGPDSRHIAANET